MHVLIIGSGGREHALAWKLKQSPLLTRLSAAPGNPGIEALGACYPIAANDSEGILAFARREGVDFVVVGPEDPLVNGLVDRLEAAGIAAFGPSAAAARLEGSKAFTKDLAKRMGIPTAAYGRFADAAAAKSRLNDFAPPYVIKADGLAAGKGVIIAPTRAEAEAAIGDLLGGKLGAAGREIVIEEFLEGEEASFFALSDGRNILPLIAAQDHKRAFDRDEGPNTGGMGAYSPAPAVTSEIESAVMSRIIRPAVEGLAAMGAPYRGVLFAGLMLTKEGPKLIEFNARFGDPECQVLMMRLESDLLPLLLATRTGLAGLNASWRAEAALTVVMAAKGYPGTYAKGSVIRGLERAAAIPGAELFHAGTARSDGTIIAAGGRVLNVAARAPTVAAARELAYRAIKMIDWPDGFYRSDIAWRALARTG